MVREIVAGDLDELLRLYLDLHEDRVPGDSPRLRDTWRAILEDPNHHILVWEEAGEIVSSCVCAVIPNLTRNVRPYALIENVVTRRDCRGRGYARACLARATEIAAAAGCYKIMLLTGAKDEGTLDFYRKCGFNSSDKTAFIRWLP